MIGKISKVAYLPAGYLSFNTPGVHAATAARSDTDSERFSPYLYVMLTEMTGPS
jgi:hypothetical protein